MIKAGTTSATIAIPVHGDMKLGQDENFTLTISAFADSAVKIVKAAATGTILNDDKPSVSVTDATVSEETGNATVTATLTEAAPFGTSVSYSVINGTALRNSDFTGSASGVLNFPAGVSTASITLGIVIQFLIRSAPVMTLPRPAFIIRPSTVECLLSNRAEPLNGSRSR